MHFLAPFVTILLKTTRRKVPLLKILKKITSTAFFIGALLILTTLLHSSPTTSLLKGEIKEPLVLILLGPPGAGKGTQASLLKETLDLPHISTGDLLRANIKEGTPLGKEAKTFIDQGKLVPDALIIDMLFQRIQEKDCKNGYILDGFPRTTAQATIYEERLPKNQHLVILNFDLSDKEIVNRIANRLTCDRCKTSYHLFHYPPKVQGKCDSCHENLSIRKDDTKEVVENRLSVYHKETKPLLHFYQSQKHFKTIQCDKSKDEIFEEVVCHLKESLQKNAK